MAIDHKAFLFDYESFDVELRSILEAALNSSNSSHLVQFIRDHLKMLKDPYEGAPLTDAWETLVEFRDPHQYGDFALTKYYDASADIGIGPEWRTVQESIVRLQGLRVSPILGSVLGPADNPFDPGKMGSYFQSNDQVRENLKIIGMLDDHSAAFQRANNMLAEAEQAGQGLYVTF